MWTIHSLAQIPYIPLTFDSTCPSCQSTGIRRSQRRGLLERLLGQILLPHRCSSCAFRFFRWANPPLPSQHSDYEDYKQPRWDEKASTLSRCEPELRVDEEPETAAPSTETAERTARSRCRPRGTSAELQALVA
jgi:hypothetical protein